MTTAEPAVVNEPDWPAEIARLTKINEKLMDRAEQSSGSGSAFSLFQTTILLENRVRQRTAELEQALLEIEAIQRALRTSEAMFHGVVNQSLVGIRLIEGERITYANAKTEEIFGLGPGESVGRDPADFVAESDRPRVLACVRATLMGESADSSYTYRGVREDGAIIDVEVHGNAIDIDARKILVSVIEDITERVRSVRELEALRDALRTESTHDALTGLYNRRYLEESLGRELRSAERDGHTVSVIMVDLDHFKAVNDHHGHLVGDAVLRKVGELVNRSARSSDICCRYGGEEFLVVLPGMSEQGALDRAEQLRIAIAAAPVSYGVLDIAMTASFGVSCFPSDARTSDELIGTADSALYAAKAAGRNRVNLASCSTHVGGTGRVARRVTTPDARTQEA